jgi:hypothetical protein
MLCVIYTEFENLINNIIGQSLRERHTEANNNCYYVLYTVYGRPPSTTCTGFTPKPSMVIE